MVLAVEGVQRVALKGRCTLLLIPQLDNAQWLMMLGYTECIWTCESYFERHFVAVDVLEKSEDGQCDYWDLNWNHL